MSLIFSSMRNASLSEKLILNFLLLGIGAIVFVGFISFYTARYELMNRTYDQLTSLRVLKKNQIENFFTDRQRDIRLIANSSDVLHTLYQLRKINKINSERKSIISIFTFENNRYLSRYLNSCGYYSEFYIFNNQGFILHTPTVNHSSVQNFIYEKRPAYFNGIFEKIKKEKATQITDIIKDKHQSTVVICTPIQGKNEEILGMAMLEISTNAINSIMVENNPLNGLGETGETYLVGADHLMRSNSRFHPNSVYKTKVNSEAVISSLANISGTKVIKDYRNKKVLSSFGHLNVPGLNWVLIAEIDYEESIMPIYKIRNETIFLSIIISLILFVFVYFFAKRITRPIRLLQEAASNIGKGDFNCHVDITSNDELGQLTDSFNNMTEQLRLKNEELVEERKKRLRSDIDGQEMERQRLSRELHDGLGQLLIAIKLKLEALIHIDRSKFIYTIEGIKSLFDKTIDEVRTMSTDLMPAVLTEFGLVNALRSLCEDISERHKLDINFNSDKINDNLSKTCKTYLYRIAQEALNNIVKHAEATKVNLTFVHHEEKIVMVIADNGKGFNFGDASLEYGNGIHNMRDRVNLLNGAFKIDSTPGKGTTIQITVPVKNNEPIE